MKKLIVIALAVVMTFAVVAFAACDSDDGYIGECSYDAHGHTYGVKVAVKINDEGKITSVKLYSEEETGWVRTSADNEEYGWTSHDEVDAAYDQWIKDNIVGKNVVEVMMWSAVANANGQEVGAGVPHIEGGTQSSARIIVAVQNAIEKWAEEKMEEALGNL